MQIDQVKAFRHSSHQSDLLLVASPSSKSNYTDHLHSEIYM